MNTLSQIEVSTALGSAVAAAIQATSRGGALGVPFTGWLLLFLALSAPVLVVLVSWVRSRRSRDRGQLGDPS